LREIGATEKMNDFFHYTMSMQEFAAPNVLSILEHPIGLDFVLYLKIPEKKQNGSSLVTKRVQNENPK
jgi:hypothetical protein